MNTVFILGLGAGDVDQLPLGVYRKLKDASPLFLRTQEHPAVQMLVEEGISFTSFDYVYEQFATFEQVYEAIVETLLEHVRAGDVFYAVPGHPLVAEKTVQLLLEAEKQGRCRVKIEGGQSFLDALFTALRIDPVEGFQLVDATSFRREDWQPTNHLIFCQVYDAFIASDVKLSLMEQLPDDYPVYIVTAAGSAEEKIVEIPLYELDRVTTLNNLTSVYVPPVKDEAMLYHRFDTLRRVIATLRGPNGCPWDRKQTHESLKKYLLEETYELFEAIDEQDDDNIIEELGDVLLQVMLHAQIGEDDGIFSIDDVIKAITEKMIHRHPHVFGDVSVQDADEVVQNWQRLKEKEKKERAVSLLDDVPKSLPNLLKAYEFQAKAAKVGFDWDDVRPMWDKVKEEMNEFQREHSSQKRLEEFGDILFALVNVARYYNINPEEALHRTNTKFYRRFSYMEEQVKNRGLRMEELSLEQLDYFWEEAKKKGR
ncbi:bifunctional methyltransferase/pyrophosphohydrolase YabN [Anoxybacteroides amylolyticum]|uniref:MazG family protein n=1 Tax=Anoxybacteroides amylolyticum TaxID=294699 RepID=A0A160F6N9_9BACL|nr:nucleoside triphosphate pyrophosphohydrolase [Anoxybacillus amylolyticus]ANB61533.1 MazG family protein [Anoxybacillus amylolyticus]